MVSFELVLFVLAVVYAVFATFSIIKLANSDEEENGGDEIDSHTYQ